MAEPMWELVTKEDFDQFEIDTAYILNDYDFEAGGVPAKESVVCVTTGDISVSHTKTMENMASDVNGINGRFAELEYVSDSSTTLSFTALNADPQTIALGLGCASVDGTKITTTDELSLEHFKDIVVVGKKRGGGLVGAKLKRTLSTGGFDMTTRKQGKGTFRITLTAFKSIEEPNVVPIEFYSTASTGE